MTSHSCPECKKRKNCPNPKSGLHYCTGCGCRFDNEGRVLRSGSKAKTP